MDTNLEFPVKFFISNMSPLNKIINPIREIGIYIYIYIHNNIYRSRSKEKAAPEIVWNRGKPAYVRINNLPSKCMKGDIMELMQSLNIRRDVFYARLRSI